MPKDFFFKKKIKCDNILKICAYVQVKIISNIIELCKILLIRRHKNPENAENWVFLRSNANGKIFTYTKEALSDFLMVFRNIHFS